MVEIKYFKDATKKEHQSYAVERMADFLKSGFSKEELINMRFFRTDILGEEINTEDGGFIDMDDGVIIVIDKRSLPESEALIPILISLVVSAAVVLLTPMSIPDQNVDSSKQSSATNSLGQAKNEPNVGGRIDDIFGTVARHTPPLWQVPYRIGVDNQEVEVNLLCIGRGQYQHDDKTVFDGDTLISRIPNACANFYGPNTYPGNGEPYHEIGSRITEKIGIYRQPNDLNPTELLPPNDLDVAEVEWRITTKSVVDGTYTIEIVGANIDQDEMDLNDHFTVGEDVAVRDVYKVEDSATVTLYWEDEVDSGVFYTSNFKSVNRIKLSGNYLVTSVSIDRFTIETDNADWDGLNNYLPPSLIYLAQNQFPPHTNNYLRFFTTNSNITKRKYLSAQSLQSEVEMTVEAISQAPSIGTISNGIVGPVTVGAEVDLVLLNCTSSSGFYKLYKNNEREIEAQVEIIYEELDDDGNVVDTHNRPRDYKTNPSNVRFSVYQTYELELHLIKRPVRIYMRRLTNRDKSSNVSNADRIEWSSVYTYEPLPSGWQSGDVTLVHWYTPSNSQSQLTKQRKFNLDVTRKITQYLGNGQFGPTESYPTDDFSQILIHTALDPYCGRLSLEHINADGFLLLREQILSYFDGNQDMIRFGYDFDDTQMAYDDMFMLICAAVYCLPYVQNGVYDAFFEGKQDTSTIQITHRNKVPDSEICEDIFESKHDGVELSYRSNVTGAMETINIPDDGSSTNVEALTFYGCTTEIQAYRKALRAYYKQIYHTKNVEFSVDDFGRMIVPGQRIDSPDSTRFVARAGNTDGYRVYDGEITEFNGLVVELSQPVTFTAGEDHYIQFTANTGENSELILCSQGGNEFEVILSTLPSFGLYDGYERDKTKFTFCSEQLRKGIALIPQTINTNIDDGSETHTLSLINYDERYYKGDTETL